MAETTQRVLYDHHGNAIERKREINLDPRFLQSSRVYYGDKATTKEPYAKHSWVYACARAIAWPSSSIPKYIVGVDDAGEEITDRQWEHPILKLLRNPNPLMSGTDLWECIYLALLLPSMKTPGGQIFLYMDSGGGRPVDTRLGQIPQYVWPYTDNVVQPDADSAGKFNGWKLVINGVTLKKFEDGELLRIRLFNPYNPLQGLSPYSASQTPVQQDMIADSVNSKYMANSGALGGVLTSDSEMLSVQELTAYVKAFEDTYMGEENAGRVAALAHGLKYDSFMKSNRDMQYAEMRADNRQRIQAAYGVNAEEIGVYESGLNRATAEQASRDVWQKTRMPLMDRVAEALNASWIEHIDNGRLRLRHDYSGVDALRDIWAEETDTAAKMVRELRIPPAEACRIVGIPVDADKYPQLDKALVSLYLVDAEIAAGGGIPSFPVTPEAGTEEGAADKAAAVVDALIREIDAGRQDIESAQRWYRYVRDTLDPGEAETRRMFTAHWSWQLDQVAKNIAAWAAQQQRDRTTRELYMPNIESVLWNGDESLKRLTTAYTKTTQKQMERAAKELANETSNAIAWKVKPENIQVFVESRRRVLQSIDSTTARQVYNVYNDLSSSALDEAWTPQEFARAVEQAVAAMEDNYSLGRAVSTARTETGSITMSARMDAFDDANVREHEWLTARDSNVRDSHQINGQKREVGQSFSNGLLYPLDPAGPAEEVINCRCMTVPVFKGGEA